MASYYVYSGAAGAGTGADWANAFTTLATAMSGKSAGDIFYVAHDHSESTAGAVGLSCPGTNATPSQILCVDRAGTVPPVSADLTTGASIATTGSNSITFSGSFYAYGLKAVAGNSTATASITMCNSNNATEIFKSCEFELRGTGGGTIIPVGAGVAGSLPQFQDCDWTFAAVGHGIRSDTGLVFRGGSVGGAAQPTNLIIVNTIGHVLIEGMDLSALGSGKTLVQQASLKSTDVLLKNCKLNANVTVTGAVSSNATTLVDLVNCDSGDTNYRTERHRYTGVMTTETTIVRSGGASDGTTAIAWKIVTNANNEWQFPFECPPIAIWNETVGSAVTATVEGVWGDGSVPDNDEIWIDAEYQGTSGFPQSVFTTGGKADILASASAHAASSETWGGSTTEFSMSVTFTPQEKGWVYIYVKAAAASATFYVDPKVTLS